MTALVEFDKLTTAQPTLKEVEKQRRYLVDLLGDTAKDDKSTIRVLTHIKGAYDNWLTNLKKPDLVSGDADAVGLLGDARKTWTKASKLEILEDAYQTAENAASPFDQAIRTQMRNVAKRKDFKTRWTVPEQRAIQGVAQGSGLDNMMSNFGILGKLVGVGGSALGAGLVTGGLAGAVAGGAVGAGAQAGSKAVAKGALEDLKYLTRTGSEYPLVKGAATLGTLLGQTGGVAGSREVRKKQNINRRGMGS